MNLIEREVETSKITLFRKYQFDMHREFIITGLKYLIDLGLNYDPTIYDFENNPFETAPDILYDGIGHYRVIPITVRLFEEKHNFLYMNIPDLISSTFFLLNGVYYVPIYYITDEPIIKKEKSILLSSTFQPITLYFQQDRAIFMGNNIQLSDFIQIITHYWPKDHKKIIERELGINITTRDIQQIVDYLSDKLYVPPDIDEIQLRIHELFFDDWTKELYQKFYNIDPIMDNVLKIALSKKIQNEKISFIDLRHKRLTFIEPILRPFFKAITRASSQLIRGKQPRNLYINIDTIVKKGFFQDLDGNVLYDTVNGFASILSHKSSFKNPFGKGKLPKEVSSIHFTHRGRICTNSITNSDPGQTVNLIPTQDIDSRYGIFKFSQQEVDYFNLMDEELKNRQST